MINIVTLPNGNLEMSLTSAGLAKFKHDFATVRLVTSAMELVFIRRWLRPMGYEAIKPEDCGALTAASLITKGGDVWGDMSYQVQAFLETLHSGGTVIWTKG